MSESIWRAFPDLFGPALLAFSELDFDEFEGIEMLAALLNGIFGIEKDNFLIEQARQGKAGADESKISSDQ